MVIFFPPNGGKKVYEFYEQMYYYLFIGIGMLCQEFIGV